MKKFLAGLITVVMAITTGFAFAKPDMNKKFAGPYYFQVSNTVDADDYSGATVTFPSSIPPTSWSGCSEAENHLCSLGFPGYKLVGTSYEPSTAPNGGTVITNYSQRTASHTKN